VPLLVVLESEQEREEIMKKGRNLRKLGDKYTTVYINRDLTLKERDELKKLIDESKDIIKNGEDKSLTWIIRAKRLVQVKILAKYKEYRVVVENETM
jgi:hypothetical protein